MKSIDLHTQGSYRFHTSDPEPSGWGEGVRGVRFVVEATAAMDGHGTFITTTSMFQIARLLTEIALELEEQDREKSNG